MLQRLAPAATLALGGVVALPLVALLLQFLGADWSLLSHLYENLLGHYLSETLFLVAGVLLLSAILGVSSAWLVALYRFPLWRFLSVGLVLPLAIPAYILGFTYVGFFEYGGIVHETLGWRIDIMNRYGAIILLSLALYPYVYLLAKSAFLGQSRTLLEASLALGKGMGATFFKVALPLARPAIVGGLMLVLMESLSDYGLVSYFGVGTLSVGIFRVWFGMGEAMSAASLAMTLMGIVFVAILLERLARGRAKYGAPSSQSTPLRPLKLGGIKGFLAVAWLLLIVGAGFLAPMMWLIYWALQTLYHLDSAFLGALLQSFAIASVAAVLVTIGALWLHFYARVFGGRMGRVALSLGVLGYAIPGAVVAVGIMIPLGALDGFLNDGLEALGKNRIGLIFSGTLFALFMGYFIRFLAAAINSLESGYALIPKELDEALFSLKKNRRALLGRLHLPLLRRALVASSLVVFVDTLKELPVTMILRPFGIDTLAIMAYEYASNERLYEVACPSLCIILVGLIPVFWLNKSMERES